MFEAENPGFQTDFLLLSTFHAIRSSKAQGIGYHMADPRRLACGMQPQHRQPRRCNPSQLGAAVAARRSASQTHVVTSQPSPRDKGAWATADQASAAAAILRPAQRPRGSILVAACLTAGRKRSPEGSRTKKESISATPTFSSLFEAVRSGGLICFRNRTF